MQKKKLKKNLTSVSFAFTHTYTAVKTSSFCFCVFAHFSKFSMYDWGKKRKMLVFTGVYVCVKAKLTFVIFFSNFFFAPFPNQKCFYGFPKWIGQTDWVLFRKLVLLEHPKICTTAHVGAHLHPSDVKRNFKDQAWPKRLGC